jgi:excisionase family DNA binding protein
MLTPSELAGLLKISKAGVYRLIEQRRIPFVKVMRSLRFDKEDVLAFLQDNRIESVGPQQYGSKKN